MPAEGVQILTDLTRLRGHSARSRIRLDKRSGHSAAPTDFLSQLPIGWQRRSSRRAILSFSQGGFDELVGVAGFEPATAGTQSNGEPIDSAQLLPNASLVGGREERPKTQQNQSEGQNSGDETPNPYDLALQMLLRARADAIVATLMRE
jgi:hypothetical protein